MRIRLRLLPYARAIGRDETSEHGWRSGLFCEFLARIRDTYGLLPGMLNRVGVQTVKKAGLVYSAV